MLPRPAAVAQVWGQSPAAFKISSAEVTTIAKSFLNAKDFEAIKVRPERTSPGRLC